MILSIIYFVFILGIIVFVHEFGHFFFAKLFGIYVYEFSIGMGPKIFKWKGKDGETTYAIGAIPIGGYCSLAGEGSEEDKKLPKKRLMQSKPIWQRFLVMFFGAGNNFILALTVLFFIGLISGCPIDKSPVVKEVTAASPAEVAGLLKGDTIVAVNGDKIGNYEDMQLYLYMSKGETEITILRDEKEEIIKVTPLTEKEKKEQNKDYSYGFSCEPKIEYEYGFINSIKYSFRKFGSLVKQMVMTFKGLFTGGISVRELSGPVGVFSAVDKTKENGVANLFSLLALLSLNVGFVNLIPFPAFDGGRIVFLLIEKIKGKPVKVETENLIHTIGFFILLGLIVFVTINDIIKLV